MARPRPIHIANAASRAGCKLIVPSDEVIASFAGGAHVWDGLHRWLQSEHGAAPHGLHSRTRVGDVTMRKLLALERERIKRDIQRKGYYGDLKKQVESTLNSSLGTFEPLEIEPKTERKLTGEGLFVLPQEPEDVPAGEEPDPWS